ncbi:hypothetical protein GXN76_04755 [Kroppenstedtia pulmonis]|uniref:Uncharacterized protein n=1 Tax=Kroppenstedtia pulmonis TaxID=1380685 RepID=A0A7D4CEG7_9BACL|nr:DUF5819 family protein [Kroppenstedtia pulmonis]QKG83854.1 hypothetical protein GXN76_04755 [Kroppenstedtia pulmonis]
MLRKILFIILGVVFVFHFIITSLYNLPINPLKIKYSPIINGYMDPIFTQNWRLFAPDPVTHGNQVYIRLKLKTGNKEPKVTGWIDLTSFMIKRNQENRFTPYNRLVRIQRGAVNAMVRRDEIINKLSEKIKEDDLDRNKYKNIIDNDLTRLQTKHAKKMVNRYSQAYVKNIYPASKIEATQVLIKEIEAVPYSKKQNSNYKPKEKVVTLDWVPYQNDIAPIF